jgi:ADP-dependent NAD(P)H-hydrate dehydratase / NAD(P)H-hydrate epimerase
MTGAWTVADVRAAEEALMARLPDGALMARAASGLARRCAELLGGVYGSEVVLLVGAGNNGGDALYAGALLARRGARVDAITVKGGHPGGLAALRAAGGHVHAAGYGEDNRRIAAADLIVDGLVGIGGKGGLRVEAAALAQATALARTAGAIVVAVDVPSGVDVDTGEVPGDAISADVTVTFGCLKTGLLVGEGARRAGLVELVDIGLELPPPPLTVVTAEEVGQRWPRPAATDDKFSRGVVGIAAGSSTYPGAAVLAAGGALAGPTGLVRYAGEVADAVRARYPEVVCTSSLADAGRVQAWVVGSGLGTGDDAAAVVREVLSTDLPVLLDADAITVVADNPSWLRERGAMTLLTPHDREFARIAGDVGTDRIGAVRRAADDFEATFLLKGDHTIVASPESVHVNPAGTAALATAGSGDVLAGLAGSLLAGGLPAHLAGAYAAFVHGLAGRYAAEDGPVTASRLVDALRAAVRTVTG